MNLSTSTKRSTFHDLFDECRTQSGKLLKGTFAPDALVYDGAKVMVCGDVLSTTEIRKIAWSNGVALIPAKTVDPTTEIPMGYIGREVRSYEKFEDFA